MDDLAAIIGVYPTDRDAGDAPVAAFQYTVKNVLTVIGCRYDCEAALQWNFSVAWSPDPVNVMVGIDAAADAAWDVAADVWPGV